MTEQEVKNMLAEHGYEDTILFMNPSYANAFVGVTTDGTAIYDYEQMVQCLINEDGMNEEEAIDWVDYNCIGSRDEGFPMVLNMSSPNFGFIGVKPELSVVNNDNLPNVA